MVSALTDRLFTGYSSSETNSSSGRMSNEAKNGPTADSGGYSADQEQSAGTPPPFYIDLLSRHRKRRASGDARRSSSDEKKQRLDRKHEMNYAAHVARHELARGGLRCPQVNCKKPRMLPSPVDMSKVTLVNSKDFVAAPKRAAPSAWNVTLTMSPDLCVDALTSIIKATSGHYRGSPLPATEAAAACSSTPKAPETEGDSSDVASTTSSVTEDGVDDVGTGESEVDSSKAAISMGQALTISKLPRYVHFYLQKM